jgi:hypothetical protein
VPLDLISAQGRPALPEIERFARFISSSLASSSPAVVCVLSGAGTGLLLICIDRDPIAFYRLYKDLDAFYLYMHGLDCFLFMYLGVFVQILDLSSISQRTQPTKQRMNSPFLNRYGLPNTCQNLSSTC